MKTGIPEIDDYAKAIQSGKIPACNFVKQAVDRHFRDMERSKKKSADFPYYFEPKAAEHFFDFCGMCNHYEGKWAGTPLVLSPWQKFVWGSIFGWQVKGKKQRRYRETYIEIPKKHGKSFLGAVVALYGLSLDQESGAQIYNLATSKSHAMKLSYRAATEIIKRSPGLASHFHITKGLAQARISFLSTSSYFEPLTSKPDSQDGFNVHMAINDEVKDWTRLDLYDVIADGTISRHQPLLFNITTAGTDRTSLGWDLRKRGIKVLNQDMTDETFYTIIYTIDDDDRDKWDEETTWKKANPGYGVSVYPEYFSQQVIKAKESPRKHIDFLTKHLNVWSASYNKYFDSVKFSKLATKKTMQTYKEEIQKRECYLFLDLASKVDLVSMYALFRYGKEGKSKKYRVIGRNYVPEAALYSDSNPRAALYREWEANGWLDIMDGETIDQQVIMEDLRAWMQLYNVKKIGLDPWNAAAIQNELTRGRIDHIIIDQNTKNLSEPMKTLDAWIKSDQIEHPADPILEWCISNVVAKEDANRNVYPRKMDNESKIDGAVALINLIAMELKKPLRDRIIKGRRAPVILST